MQHQGVRNTKKRINHERLLSFNGIDQNITFSGDDRHNFADNDFSIYLISAEFNTGSQNCLFEIFGTDNNIRLNTESVNNYKLIAKPVSVPEIQVSSSNFNFAPFSGLNKLKSILIIRRSNLIELYFNGYLLLNMNVGAGEFDFSAGGLTIGSRNGSGFAQCMVSNFIIFEGALNNSEIMQMHNNGGHVPINQHVNVVNHWPLSQKYYNNSPNTVWDVVEKYSYSKRDLYNVEKLENGDFSDGQSGWTAFNTTDSSWDFSNNTATLIPGSSGGIDQLSQVPLTPIRSGVLYQLTFTLSGVVNGGVIPSIANVNVGSVTGTLATLEQVHTQTFFIPENNDDPDVNAVLQFNTNIGSASLTIDDVSLVALSGRGISREPLHGTLNNFTNDQCGSIHPASQSVIRDVYSKIVSKNWGLRSNGVDQSANQSPLTNTVILGSTNFSLYFDLVFDSINGNNFVLDTFNLSSSPFLQLVFISSSEIQFVVAENSNGNNESITINTDAFQKRDRIKLLIDVPDPSDNSTWKVIINKKVNSISLSASDNNGSVSIDLTALRLFANASDSQHASIQINDIHIYNDILTEREKSILFEKNIPGTPLLERINLEKRTDNIINTLSGNQLTLSNFNIANFDVNYRQYEGLPEITKCITLDSSTKQIEFDTPVSIDASKGLTFVFGFSKLNNDVWDQRTNSAHTMFRIRPSARYRASGTYNTRSFYFGGVTADINIDLGQLDNINVIAGVVRNVGALGFDIEIYVNGSFVKSSSFPNLDINQQFGTNNQQLQLNWSANNYLGHRHLFQIYDRAISRASISKLSNNTLYSSIPDKNLLIDMRVNEGLFFEDGTNVKSKNLGYMPGNWNWTGFAGASTSDQLNDLLSFITPLESLR